MLLDLLGRISFHRYQQFKFKGLLAHKERTGLRTMHVQPIAMWAGIHDNYAYLVKDDVTKEGVIIDPGCPSEVIPILKEQIDAGSLKLTAIMNTHHHWDHTGGNEQMLKKFRNVKRVIGGRSCDLVNEVPQHQEVFYIGQNVKVTALKTPCHTEDSVCFFMEDGDDRVVFTGDTLFIGGCGRFFEGTGEDMYKSLATLAALPDDTRVYPGHEYTKSNLKFLLHIFETDAVKRLENLANEHKETAGLSTIGDEKLHNVFMRADDPEVQRSMGGTGPIDTLERLRAIKTCM